jgi:hypothetical protein
MIEWEEIEDELRSEVYETAEEEIDAFEREMERILSLREWKGPEYRRLQGELEDKRRVCEGGR